MKILINMIVLLSFTTIVIGCGGGSNTSTITQNNTTPATANTTDIISIGVSELIINNGRGTSNNQDTETEKNHL